MGGQCPDDWSVCVLKLYLFTGLWIETAHSTNHVVSGDIFVVDAAAHFG